MLTVFFIKDAHEDQPNIGQGLAGSQTELPCLLPVQVRVHHLPAHHLFDWEAPLSFGVQTFCWGFVYIGMIGWFLGCMIELYLQLPPTSTGVGLGSLHIYKPPGAMDAACPETTLWVRRPYEKSVTSSPPNPQRPCLSLPNPSFSASLPQQLGFWVMSAFHEK